MNTVLPPGAHTAAECKSAFTNGLIRFRGYLARLLESTSDARADVWLIRYDDATAAGKKKEWRSVVGFWSWKPDECGFAIKNRRYMLGVDPRHRELVKKICTGSGFVLPHIPESHRWMDILTETSTNSMDLDRAWLLIVTMLKGVEFPHFENPLDILDAEATADGNRWSVELPLHASFELVDEALELAEGDPRGGG